MKRRLLFILSVFIATIFLMSLQKPVFLLYYHNLAAGSSLGELSSVVLHGLKLDLTVAGYITSLPLLMVLVSIWIKLSDRVWRRIFIVYFTTISLITAAIFALDIGLYEFWGFRLDRTVVMYLSDPKNAAASVGVWQWVRQAMLLVGCAAIMIWCYIYICRIFSGAAVRLRLMWSVVVLVMGGVLFIAMRGGLSVATANISKVYFSRKTFLNHAATNPIFSFLSTLGNNENYASEYPFFDQTTREKIFETIRGNGGQDTTHITKVLRTERPNVVIILLESFGRTITDHTEDGRKVTPNLQQLKSEGIWFENMISSSFRTDRGEVAILSGFPAQTRASIMKLPAKSRSLPSIARSLGGEGYSSSFYYGGDINFTNQASYLYGTGWDSVVWQRDIRTDVPTSKWGYDDAVMGRIFTDYVIRKSHEGRSFLAGWLTLSSHEPFEVPYSEFEDPLLNSMAFTDNVIGEMISRLRASSAWDELLIVLIADHYYGNFPDDGDYRSADKHRIPMIWTGGAVEKPLAVETYMSQIDLCATLLSQMGVGHSDFDYSKNAFSSAELPHKFGYYCFVDGFGVVDASGETIYDCTSSSVTHDTGEGGDRRLEIGKTMLQTTYEDIGRR